MEISSIEIHLELEESEWKSGLDALEIIVSFFTKKEKKYKNSNSNSIKLWRKRQSGLILFF